MTWLVRYTAASGEVVTARHDTREVARDALVDQLLASALQLWRIGQAFPANTYPEYERKRQSYFDRGDRFIHHAARLMETTEDSYVIAGAGGRKWILWRDRRYPPSLPGEPIMTAEQAAEAAELAAFFLHDDRDPEGEVTGGTCWLCIEYGPHHESPCAHDR